MPFQSNEREIRIVVRGRNLTTFREQLRVGQIVRGRVVDLLPDGRVVLSLCGCNLIAETRGVTVGCGQTLDLLVKDTSGKVELQWLSRQDSHRSKPFRVSDLTRPRLLGMLSRLHGLLCNVAQTDAVRKLQEAANRLRHRAQRGAVFLPRAPEYAQSDLVPGEVVTMAGGLPALLRLGGKSGESQDQENGAQTPWFELCHETLCLGPVTFTIFRNDGKLNCILHVLDGEISHCGKSVETLKSELACLGYPSVEVSVTGLNQEYPDILLMLDRVCEENVNFRV